MGRNPFFKYAVRIAEPTQLASFYLFAHGLYKLWKTMLKVLANEKRGVLAVVSFDRSRFKLFSRKFSNKCVQAPSCERLKTAPRTLFLSFESNNCFPITVQCRRLMKKSGKLACHVVNSNIAIGSLPTLQTLHGLLALFEKIYYGEPVGFPSGIFSPDRDDF